MGLWINHLSQLKGDPNIGQRHFFIDASDLHDSPWICVLAFVAFVIEILVLWLRVGYIWVLFLECLKWLIWREWISLYEY